MFDCRSFEAGFFVWANNFLLKLNQSIGGFLADRPHLTLKPDGSPRWTAYVFRVVSRSMINARLWVLEKSIPYEDYIDYNGNR